MMIVAWQGKHMRAINAWVIINLFFLETSYFWSLGQLRRSNYMKPQEHFHILTQTAGQH